MINITMERRYFFLNLPFFPRIVEVLVRIFNDKSFDFQFFINIEVKVDLCLHLLNLLEHFFNIINF